MQNKVKIEPIDIPETKLEILKGLIENYDEIDTMKRDLIRKNVGGACSICQGFPTKKVTRQLRGALLIERYCNECFSKSGINV